MLEKQEENAVEPMLKQYNHITVRENVGVDIMQSMGIKAQHMLDPTLLFTGEQWQKYTSSKFEKKNYVVTYNLHHDKRIDEYASQLAKENGLKVYNISYNLHDIVRKGTLKWCPTIEEYLGLIRDAQYVVTDSFHATVFSILFHTKFMAIYPEQASSRIRSILSLTSLEERGTDEMPTVAQAMKSIDFTNADAVLKQERGRAKEYITKVLSEISEEG